MAGHPLGHSSLWPQRVKRSLTARAACRPPPLIFGAAHEQSSDESTFSIRERRLPRTQHRNRTRRLGPSDMVNASSRPVLRGRRRPFTMSTGRERAINESPIVPRERIALARFPGKAGDLLGPGANRPMAPRHRATEESYATACSRDRPERRAPVHQLRRPRCPHVPKRDVEACSSPLGREGACAGMHSDGLILGKPAANQARGLSARRWRSPWPRRPGRRSHPPG